ncbi:MAG: hypothetical protein A2271_01875 [Candidatus Moranbacteria bacterium RIFOXYA12_FULL_35_19]|nr:MAG: hypothetical protein UR78_C0017G0009 [Candidatus Moranbacteria bacterium GW2011_GWF2_35_39]OGI32165.1 MAG: hypothetical protein A2343_02660 [Candidatus Moranbacteria bacterium RIFOXYB12_FULL_35_8]OGI35518.1 MAG: hypothetical protein A2271_01875 [Candidatus Moranbacteria bacterium RIFOXYA12_FULL_35_19]
MDIILKRILEHNDEEKTKVYPGRYTLILVLIQDISSGLEKGLYFFVSNDPIMEGICIEYWMFHILKNMGFIEIKKY